PRGGGEAGPDGAPGALGGGRGGVEEAPDAADEEGLGPEEAERPSGERARDLGDADEGRREVGGAGAVRDGPAIGGDLGVLARGAAVHAEAGDEPEEVGEGAEDGEEEEVVVREVAELVPDHRGALGGIEGLVDAPRETDEGAQHAGGEGNARILGDHDVDGAAAGALALDDGRPAPDAGGGPEGARRAGDPAREEAG